MGRDTAPPTEAHQTKAFPPPSPLAPAKLNDAIARAGTPLCVGLEPDNARLPATVTPSIEAHERHLLAIIEATAPFAAAYKPNLAFFEALGPDGWKLLFTIRRAISRDAFLIADAKRSDIGSSAERYATAIFDQLDADAVTVNPLMGRDAVEPFLQRPDTLAYTLCLTSNPGASDFLIPNNLFNTIAERTASWSGPAHRGLVVGATAQPQHLATLAATLNTAFDQTPPLLIPGVGAQGGSIDTITSHLGDPRASASLIHATRALLPDPDEATDEHTFAAAVARITERFATTLNNSINAATQNPPCPEVSP